MFDFIQAAIQPILVDYLVWILVPIIAFPLRILPKRWRLDVEAKHLDALHRAVDTAVGLVFDIVQRHPGIAIPDAAITLGIGYITGSVPDAIKRLGPSQATLEAMLRSKIQTRLDDLAGRDRLMEALQRIEGVT